MYFKPLIMRLLIMCWVVLLTPSCKTQKFNQVEKYFEYQHVKKNTVKAEKIYKKICKLQTLQSLQSM